MTPLQQAEQDAQTRTIASPYPPNGSPSDRYELLDALGTGSTATVWRARDIRTGLEMAVKRFHGQALADPMARQRFADEAAAASLVSHPNIVAAVDRVVTDDELWLVFPYVAGTTLAERLADRLAVAHRQAAQIVIDVADALAAVHAAGLAHRDVKPGNILLGLDGRARLLDFGISRTLADELEQARDATGAGLAVGTLPYMAPEQLAAKVPTPATDVFALGVVLYEMLAARRPYPALTPVAMAEAHRTPPAAISEAPAALSDLALAALAYDPAARPDATQFARAARGFLDGRHDPAAVTAVVPAVVPAAQVPAAQVPPVADRRLLRAIAGAAAVVLLLVAGVGAGSLLPVGPNPSSAPPTEAAEPLREVPSVAPNVAEEAGTPPDTNSGNGGSARNGNDAGPAGNGAAPAGNAAGPAGNGAGPAGNRPDTDPGAAGDNGKAKGHDKHNDKGKGGRKKP